jgi:hypothetical protein
VDVRVKTFVQEAASRLDFLRTDYGFTGPEVMPDQAGGYPLLQKVRYRRGDLALETGSSPQPGPANPARPGRR